jgi:hypothetical protein
MNLSIISFITTTKRDSRRGLVAIRNLFSLLLLVPVPFAPISALTVYSYALKTKTASPFEVLPTRVHYFASQK